MNARAAHVGSSRPEGPTHLLVADADDTLLGDANALEDFARWYRDQSAWLAIAYASGRSVESLTRSVDEYSLPDPIALIGHTGTEIAWYPSGDALKGWPVGPTQDWDPERVRLALEDVTDLHLQPPEAQSEYKVSYTLPNARGGTLKMIRDFLEEEGLGVDLLYGGRRDLDIVPRGVNKGSAAHFLADRLDLDDDHVLVCGSTMHDVDLFLPGFHGIVVAGADEELRRFVADNAHVSEQSYARGVLEGIEAWVGKH